MVVRGTFISAVLALVCAAAAACNDLEGVVRRHERQCREEAGMIVHDPALWKRYQEGARANHAARARKYGDTGPLALEYVQGFEQRFGPELSTTRPPISRRLERNDITLLYGNIRVATAVDIIGSYPAFGHTESFSCLSFPELYRRAAPGRR